jgi:glycosyltransferase involved in cell wall biosynthesis
LKDCTANNSLLEGLACGVPAVTTDLPGIRDYTNACNAWYYKHEKECLEFIVDTIKDEAQLAQRSADARKFMCDNFSLDKVAAEHAAVYQSF